MKFLACLLFLFSPVLTKAVNYYVNPSSDSTKETGSITTPWKSLASVNASMRRFKPGDSILLKKGELYYDQLEITCSGTAAAPIVFTTFGNASAIPVFLFKKEGAEGYTAIHLHRSKYIVLDGFEITDDRMDKENRFLVANVDIAVDIDTSDFIVVKNCKVSLVGVGVNIKGSKNIIYKCRFDNLRMIRNTPEGDDDYGANPVVIAGPDNIISNCFFKDCWANSYDYQFDGGAIEMFGASADNNKITNNVAINCNGFLEIGSINEGSADNTLVAQNNIINCGELVYINNGGKYKIGVSHLWIFSNNIINSVNRLTNPTSMIGMRTILPNRGMINLEGNVFWLTSGINVGRANQFLNGQLIHKNNTYYMSSGTLNFPPDASESIIDKNSPSLNQLLSQHPGLKNMDIFPFIYLPGLYR